MVLMMAVAIVTFKNDVCFAGDGILRFESRLVGSTPQCYYGRISADVTERTTMTSNIFKRGLWNHRWIKLRSAVKTYIGLHDYYIKEITEQYINYVR
uniref:Uncharacterized protein n=1 Tax=Timema bartmani TaxID=61472 RepID=A0A7R9FCB9_9NEOP|nr:unnamed protein product [Timema bartmani]